MGNLRRGARGGISGRTKAALEFGLNFAAGQCATSARRGSRCELHLTSIGADARLKGAVVAFDGDSQGFRTNADEEMRVERF